MLLNTYKMMIKLAESYRFLYIQILQVCHHSVNFIHYSIVTLSLAVIACYRQYDTMICPRSAKTMKNREQLVNYRFMNKEEAVIPQPSLMRQICLEFHLLPSKNLFLQGNVYDAYDVSFATDGLVHLFECCYQQKVSVDTSYRFWDSVDIIPMESLKEV